MTLAINLTRLMLNSTNTNVLLKRQKCREINTTAKFMELVQKYWYLVIAALVLLFFLARRGGGGMSVQQIGGADANTLALAQLTSAEREADENRRFGLIGAILNYQLSNKNLDQQIDLAKIAGQAQTEALKNQYLLASLQSQTQAQVASQQFALQNSAIQRAYNNQRRSDWLGAISTGVQTFLPALFGNMTSGTNIFGSGNFPSTPPIFGSGGGTWQGW